MPRNNERRHKEWHETCKCKSRLDASVCNDKQRWNEDKCRCECKELIDKGICDTGFIWNPSNCEWECDKSCDKRKYFDNESCKCRKKLIEKLVEEFNENIDGNEMIYSDYRNVCNSCTIYIVLFFIAFLIIMSITCACFYFHWYLKEEQYQYY